MHHNPDDRLIPAPEAQRRYGVSAMTLHRWLKREDMDFPQPLMINRRRYFRVADLAEWERTRASKKAA